MSETTYQAPDLALSQRICDFLNELLEADRAATIMLIERRVPCSNNLVDHPTVQVIADRHGGNRVGLLGVLNGLCGIYEDGYGPICVVYDSETPEGSPDPMSVSKFRLTEAEDRKPTPV